MNVNSVNNDNYVAAPISSAPQQNTSDIQPSQLQAIASKVTLAIQNNLEEVKEAQNEIGTDSKLNSQISREGKNLAHPATPKIFRQSLNPEEVENTENSQISKNAVAIDDKDQQLQSGSDLDSDDEDDEYLDEESTLTKNHLDCSQQEIKEEGSVENHQEQIPINNNESNQENELQPNQNANPPPLVQKLIAPGEQIEDQGHVNGNNQAENQENELEPNQNANLVPLAQELIEPERPEEAHQQVPDNNLVRNEVEPQQPAPLAAPANNGDLNEVEPHLQVAPPAVPVNNRDPELGVQEVAPPPNLPPQVQRAEIRAQDIQQIKDTANNDNVNTTQQILETACVNLKNLGPADAKVKIKSKLETDPDGSYILETYRCDDKDYYRINCGYTLTLTDAQGNEIKDNQGNPVQTTIKKYIFLKTHAQPKDALLSFTKYKDLITQLVTQNANGRLTGDYNAANRAALLNQHDFTFSLNTDQNTGLKSLNQISAQLPNNGGNPAQTLNLNLTPKQLGENVRYVRDFNNLRGPKAKKAQITKFVSGKRVYQSKEHALQEAAYKIKDPQAYQKLIQEKNLSEVSLKLYLITDEMKQAGEKLDNLQAAFKESRFLGLGSQNTEKYGEFLKETASQIDADKFKKARPKEETKSLKLEEQRKTLTHDINSLNTQIQSLQNVQNQPANFGALPQANKDFINNQNLTIEKQLKELKAINPALQVRIDALLTSNRPAAYYLQDAANADIVQELNNKSQDIKLNAAATNLIEKRDKKTEALEQLKQSEMAFQAKQDAFNKHLIELENAHQEFLELTHRLRNLREQAEREPNPAEPNHHKILEEITEKQLAALEKKAAESEKFIKQIRKDLDDAGVKLTPKDAPANVLNIADRGR